jgi:hypothetical protein
MSTNEDEEPQLPTLAHMLTPCEQDRFEDHANLRSSLQGLGGEYIVDLDQNPPFSHGSSLVPTLVTHGKLYSFVRDELMVPANHFAVMGHPIWPGLDEGLYDCAFADMILNGSVSEPNIKHLAGNGMHVTCVGSVVMCHLDRSCISIR